MRTKRELVLERFYILLNEDVYKVEPTTELPPGTVLLAAGTKSGSTWMQHILHGLRSGGCLDFEEINNAVPILEISKAADLVVKPKRGFQPPIFKAQSEFQKCPSAEKVIVVTRHPSDAAVSLYHYSLNYIFTKNEMSMDEFVRAFIIEEGDDNHIALNAFQMRHLASWYRHRRDENVLWLHYEDLKADLTQCIKLISDFIGVGVGNQDLLDLVEHQSSLEFMRQHASKFSTKGFRQPKVAASFLPDVEEQHVNVGNVVRNGAVKEFKKAFSSETKELMKQKWVEMLKPVTGYDSYEEMRAAINRELGRSFPA